MESRFSDSQFTFTVEARKTGGTATSSQGVGQPAEQKMKNQQVLTDEVFYRDVNISTSKETSNAHVSYT